MALKGACVYNLGIDIGSTTVKYVVVDEQDTIVASHYTPHHTKQAQTLYDLLSALEQSRPELFSRIAHVYMTGSGATPLLKLLNARFVQEVNAVTVVVERLHPDVRSVIELGGQDAKIIHFRVSDDGKRSVFASMNDKCASGTGATIEKCTQKVGFEKEDLSRLKFDDGKLHKVAAKCGVFAETDIVNLVKSSVPAEEIINSLADAIVMQNLTVLTRGQTLLPKVLLLGGPNTYLPFLQACWRKRIAELWDEREVAYDASKLDELIVVPDHAEYYAALGAVIFGTGEGVEQERFGGLKALRAHIDSHANNAQSIHDDAPLAQDKTEVERFLERYRLEPFVPATLTKKTRCFLGIDGGSTSSKAVLINEEGRLIAKAYRLSRGNPIEDTLALLVDLKAQDRGGFFNIVGLGVTGYAADVLEGALRADANIIETIAHMRSAIQIFGESVDVICDIGGQDIKVLFLQNGMLKHFKLSNQCSAGNGMLLQSMAKQFGVAIEEFAEVAFRAKRTPKFNYGCAVFLDTDRVNFQKEGYSKEELFAGIAKVLPKNVWQYVVQAPNIAMLGKHFVLQGGTQYNQAALKAQVDYIASQVPDARIDLHPHPGEAGAIGAALEARKRVQERGYATFVGIEEALQMTYTTRTDESTRCYFCSIECARTFIDTKTPSGKRVRYIAGFSCEDGTVESHEALRALKQKRKELSKAIPNLVAVEAKMLFKKQSLTYAPPHTLTKAHTKLLFGGWGPKITLKHQKAFKRANEETLAWRKGLSVAIPRVLNIYSLAPFMRAYLEALGIASHHVRFTSTSNEEMFLEGAKYGSVDSCYPAKVAQSHVYQILFGAKFQTHKPHFIWFPAVTHLPNFLTHTVADTACPIVSGTPKVVKSAFVKERDLFAKFGADFVDDPLNFEDKALLECQLLLTWQARLRISEDENYFAMQKGFEALAKVDAQLQAQAKQILDEAEQKGQMVILLIGRPYHSDPGLNHEILDEFQSLGFKVISQRSIPRDEAYVMRFFGKEIAQGKIETPFDIRDVWPENYSANSATKVWAAKFAARHPNVAVVDISSFKCGHDAPTYGIIDKILSASNTPHLTLHDLDANKPGGSFKIRIKTFAYTLKEREKGLQTQKGAAYDTATVS